MPTQRLVVFGWEPRKEECTKRSRAFAVAPLHYSRLPQRKTDLYYLSYYSYLYYLSYVCYFFIAGGIGIFGCGVVCGVAVWGTASPIR